MKKSILLLFVFAVTGIQTMAETTAPMPVPTLPPIRRQPAAPTPTPPPIRVPGKTAAETPEQQMAKRQGFFAPNTVFEKDKPYYSEDKRYYLAFQSDGNLVIYKVAGSKAIWNSHTNGRAVKSCVFQDDGNLVLYDYAGKAVWDSNTDAKNRKKKFYEIVSPDDFRPPNPWMTMQSDGNLVIYRDKYPAIKGVQWSSNSFEKN